MTKKEIIAAVKKLELPKGEYIVFGSCPLAAAGIREAGDIDMLVSKGLLNILKKAGWKQVIKGPKDKPYTHSVFEAHANWDFSQYSPTLKQLLKSATFIGGIPFASLAEVRKWKLATGGDKHLEDVRLIDNYLNTN